MQQSTMKAVQDSGSNGDQNVLRKGPWMPEEDEILVEYVRQYGARDWSSIRSKGLLPRTGKSCRLRWVNKLKPDLKSGCKFSPEEEKLVVEMQAKLGNKWAKIASYLPGRTDNDVKNFWSTRQKRIMRALQRPKTQSADMPDMTKVRCFTDFSPFEVQAPTPLQAIPFGAPIPFPDEVVDDPCINRQMPLSNEMDDMLMVKLQDLVAGDSLFMDADFSQALAVVSDDTVSQGSAMSSTLNNVKSPKSAPAKRKRPAVKDSDVLSAKREKIPANTCYQAPEVQLLPDISHGHDDGNRDFGVDLYIDPNDSNILDFLLQPEQAVSVQNSSTFSSGSLPPLRPEDIQGTESVVKEEVDSCTPDSVLVGFPGDVFDSLEPLSLSPTASEWWDSRLREL